MGLMGREKLIDPLFSAGAASATLVRLVTRGLVCPFGLAVITPGPLSKLTPLPPAFVGGGEPMRCGGSTLDALRDDLVGTGGGDTYPRQSEGTGGGSSARFPGAAPRFGEGWRNVLSVMDPELFCRCGQPGPTVALPLDAADSRLCIIRFVCIEPTGSGDVVCDRRAAAAAADESCPLETLLARNAWAAAVLAADVAGVLMG